MSSNPSAIGQGIASSTASESAAASDVEIHPHAVKNRFARLDMPVVIVLGSYHVLALLAPFYFTWQGFVAFAIFWWLTGGIGICMCYHRMLTHRSFETYAPVRWFLAFMGTLASEGSPIDWVATHRQHHRFSDHEGDPHSPKHGVWWSHMLWLIPWRGSEDRARTRKHYASDLLKDPAMVFFHHTHGMWHIVTGMSLFLIGFFAWDLHTGISMLIWGMFFRLVWVLHVTWAVNSATHIWGYRNYTTKDDSRNLWWVGLMAFGEGWHNNHHAYPRMAAHGHRWWEFDITYSTILLMEKLGLAWKVVHRSNLMDRDDPANEDNTVIERAAT